MLGAGIAVIKSHTSTHEEWEVEAIAMVSNEERIGPEVHSDDCNLRRRGWSAALLWLKEADLGKEVSPVWRERAEQTPA